MSVQVSAIILIIIHLSILCFFPTYLSCADFTFIITDVGVLIRSGQTIEVTVCKNVKLIFTLSLQK